MRLTNAYAFRKVHSRICRLTTCIAWDEWPGLQWLRTAAGDVVLSKKKSRGLISQPIKRAL